MSKHFVLASAGLVAVGALGAGAWALVSPAVDWQVGGPFGGTALTVTVDPQNTKTVLAGAMNSLLYQSTDAGANWTMLDFPKRNLGEVTSILVDPANSSHYLVGALDAWGGGLYESVDAGKAWSLSNDFKNVGVRALAVAPSMPSEFVAGTLKGVQLSNDSGKTWKRISDPNNLEMQGITAVAIDTADPNIIYAGTAHLPWRTTDGGKTWQSIHTGMIDDSDVFSIYVDPKSPTTVFASACSGIYESSTRGDSWHKIAGIPNTSRRTHVIREDPVHSGTIFAGTTMGLFRSPNLGANWKTLTPTQVNAMAFDPTQPSFVYLAMEYDGVAKSLDGGDSIRLIDDGFVDRQISALTRSGNNLVGIETQEGDTTGIFVSADAGSSWTQAHSSPSLAGIHLHSIAGTAADGKTMIAATTRQLYRTSDAGAIWRPLVFRVATEEQIKVPVRAGTRSHTSSKTTATKAPATRTRVTVRTVQPGDINGLYTIKYNGKESIAVLTGTGLYVTADGGERWKKEDVGAQSPVVALYSSASGNGWMIVKSNDALYATKDNGSHWEHVDFPLPMGDINAVAVPSDPSCPILVATRVGLYSSADGTRWVHNAGALQGSTVSAVAYQGNHTAYAVEYGELFKSDDAGANWTQLPTRLHSLGIRQLWVTDTQSSRLYAITSGLGVLFRD